MLLLYSQHLNTYLLLIKASAVLLLLLLCSFASLSLYVRHLTLFTNAAATVAVAAASLYRNCPCHHSIILQTAAKRGTGTIHCLPIIKLPHATTTTTTTTSSSSTAAASIIKAR
jgi:hypothetical protein